MEREEKSGLIETIRIPLSELQRERLRRIDGFDYSGVVRKVTEELPDVSKEYLDAGVNALKQYYAVALLDPINEHAVSAPVDPFWHSHILFTREYHRFCDEVFGQYIHHQPLDKSDLQDVERVTDLYNYTRDMYGRIFEEVDNEMWPEASLDTVICRHYEVKTEEIRNETIFPSREVA